MDIDFDYASTEWRKNKKHVGEGMFKYTCQYIDRSGEKCGHDIYSDNKNSYIFGGIHEYLDNDPIVKKACKRHKNRFVSK
jgi:hypothetical protein